MATSWLLLALYFFALAAPLSVAGGNIGAGLVVLAAMVAAGLSPQARRAVPWRIVLAFTAVLVWNTVSTVAADPGTRHWYKLFEEWWMKSMMIAVPVVLGSVFSRAHLRRVVAVLLASGVFVAAYGVWQHFFGQDLVRHRQLLTTGDNYLAVGFTNHHLSFGGQLMYLISLSGAMALAGLGERTRIWLVEALETLVLALALVWTYARSSLLAVGASFAFLAVVQTGRARRAGLALLALAVLAVVATPSLRGRMLETFNNPKEVTRLNLWRSSISGIEARPVTGWGPANFGLMMETHEYPGYYEARGHAHNDLLMQAVNAGIPGMLAFLWLYWEIFHLLWRGLRVAVADRGIITGAMACQVAAMVGGLFQVFQTDDEPEMLLYFILGCGLAVALRSLAEVAPKGDIPG